MFDSVFRGRRSRPRPPLRWAVGVFLGGLVFDGVPRRIVGRRPAFFRRPAEHFHRPAKCAELIADARWLIYLQGSWLPALREWTKSCTEAVKLAETSPNTKMFVLPVFVPPAAPVADPSPGGLPAVIPVLEGALVRIFTTVQLIKDHEGFTPQIGADLGVVGSVDAGPDWATLAPELKVAILNGQVAITWGWLGWGDWLDACEIQVDRGNGWQPLVVDTTPNYVDTTPFPAAVANWKYRAIFNEDGARRGNWSNIVTLAVGG